jgi:SAM-dependent methyltransferase
VTDDWAPNVGKFVDSHYASVRGQVRLRNARRQLEMFVPEGPLEIVDVGGGAGTNSIPWARDGHTVTILDSSPAMLDKAREVVAAESGEVAARVTFHHGLAEEASADLGRTFDVVLCHGVIMYVDDPSPVLDSLAALCRPAGHLSLMAKNRHGLPFLPAQEGRWGDVLAALDATTEVNRLGLVTRADTVEGLTADVEERGFEVLDWFGVRLFSDGALDDQQPGDAFEDLLEAEFEASRRDPYRQVSRLIHVVGRRS